jgi:hypothetical protein
LYKTLIENGISINEIDEMDIYFYMSLYEEKKERVIEYADDVPWL